ncbi:unnamed protein product, partial [Laminaria digitata]
GTSHPCRNLRHVPRLESRGILASCSWHCLTGTRSSAASLEGKADGKRPEPPMADPFDGLVGHQQGAAAPLGHFEGAGSVAQTSSQPAWPGMAGAAPRWHQQQQQHQQYPLPSGVGVSSAQGVVQHGNRAGETQNSSFVASSSSASSAQPAQQAPPGGGYAAYGAYPAHNQTPPAAAPWGGNSSGTASPGGGGGGGGGAPSYINTNTAANAAVLHPAVGYGGVQRNQAASQQQQQMQQPGYYNPNANATTAFQGPGAFLSAATPQPERKALASPRADGLGSSGGGGGGNSLGMGGTGAAAGAEWTPPAEQLHVYEGMFGVASASSAVPGTVSGRAAVQFFSRSGLPKDSLKTIWSLCDPSLTGCIHRPGFFAAMRLIALAQGGPGPGQAPATNLSMSALEASRYSPLPPPRMAGVPPAAGTVPAEAHPSVAPSSPATAPVAAAAAGVVGGVGAGGASAATAMDTAAASGGGVLDAFSTLGG